MRSFFTALMICLSANVTAQFDNIIYDDYVYVDYIKSVTFSHSRVSTSYPVIDLGSRYQGRLKLAFDDMEGGFKTYLYRIIHCDKDWYPSDIGEIEYLNGFNYEEIDEFAYSANTYSEYTHYELFLPNDDLSWMISGNYLLAIYDEDLEIAVLTRRFMVTESAVDIGQSVIKPKNVRKMNTHQELNITVNYKNFHVSRPLNELYVTVIQNGNWNSAVRNIQGTYERGDAIYFDRYDNIVFPALKEFRNFDIRSLKYTTEYVNAIEQNDYETNVLLDLNRKRSNRNFATELDANGFFIIDNFDYGDPDVSAEYANVIFTLEAYRKYDDPLYIVGAFSDWQAKEEYLLEYDESRGIYVGTAQFKQGFYDYMFALQDEDGNLDIDRVEGSWYETENDYMVLVYLRSFGGLYDRLLAVSNFNSNPQD